jgi:alpha-soluble NSF attachment protein
VAPEQAVESFQTAILLMIDAGRVLQAAKLSKECAELYETEGETMVPDHHEKSHVVLALEAYEQAAELFTAENSNSQASSCWIKVAELCSAALDPPDMIRAARLFEDIGRSCLASNLLKFNAKGYFLQAILCHLANQDVVAAQQAKSRYESLDYTFGSAREGTLATQLIDCVEGMDPDGFSTACFEYDRVSKLDPWKTSMLVKIKRTIDDGGNPDDDDDVDLT